MAKTLQEQEDKQGFSIDENTYYHPAAGLNGLVITASSPVPGLDPMLSKRITNKQPSAVPVKRSNSTSTSKHFDTSAKRKHTLQLSDQNVAMPSTQNTISATSTNQHTYASLQHSRRILPSMNPAQHDSRPTFQQPQTPASTIDASIPSNAPKPLPSRIIQAPSQPKNWLKKQTNSSSEYKLSDEQKAIHDAAVYERKSVFFTGTAGTGKSVVLRAIIESLRRVHGAHRVAVTASTGLAACHIGGVTLHSEFNIGLGDKNAEYYIKQIKSQQKNYQKLNSFAVLIIDEISMIDAKLFDKIDYITRIIRKNDKPFGGMQVVLCGDFYQLPPINRSGSNIQYAFQANCWDRAIKETMVLTKAFRQTDQHFTDILNQLKRGIVSDQTAMELQRLQRPLPPIDGIEPTELYPLRRELDTANNGMLDALSGEAITYKSTDSGNIYLLKHCLAPAEITLKVHAQVMLTKNLTPTLVNGSRGVVVGFEEDSEKKLYPRVKFANQETLVISQYSFTFDSQGFSKATRVQLPLILAWALSIHKSQGQTIDYLRIDLKNSFDYGHAYVALSRVRSMEKLQVLNFTKSVVKAHKKVIEFYDEVDRKKSNGEQMPVSYSA